MKKVVFALMMTALCAVPAGAGQAAQQGSKPQTSAPPAAAPAPQSAAARRAEPINIRYQIAIREENASQKPTTKTVSMIGTLMEVSMVRAAGQSGPGSGNPLNVDITPTDLRDSKVRTKIGVQYNPLRAEPPVGTAVNIMQTVHVWLDSGKPMVISESVDPNSDRRFVIEVTATILR
jgi:hypothetical protein